MFKNKLIFLDNKLNENTWNLTMPQATCHWKLIKSSAVISSSISSPGLCSGDESLSVNGTMYLSSMFVLLVSESWFVDFFG